MEETREMEINEIIEEAAVYEESGTLEAEAAEDVTETAEQEETEAVSSEETQEEGETISLGLDDDIEDQDQIVDNSGAVGSVTVVGVRFRTAGKVYYFSPAGYDVRRGTHVIVETARGVEYGTAVCDPMEIEKKSMRSPIRQILRIADEEDLRQVVHNKIREKEALRVCRQKIREHNLDMKLIDAEYTFDGSRILFYFTAEGRVDFRDLVKDLAGIFRTRIELRQIGVRDETKILGGYGICGRPLCCHSYLSDFIPVSIKMAKEQNLSLNPTKISGVCGRLMCCLKNEEDTYEELNRLLPRIGDEVEGSDGLQGEVESVNVLRQRVRILVDVDDEKELHEYPASDVTILRRRRRGQARPKLNRNSNPEQGKAKTVLPGAKKASAAAEELRKENTAPAKAEERKSEEKKAADDQGSRQQAKAPRERRKNDRRDRGHAENETREQRVKQNRKNEPEAENTARTQAGENRDLKGQAEQDRKDRQDRRPGRNRRDFRRSRPARGKGKENGSAPSAE